MHSATTNTLIAAVVALVCAVQTQAAVSPQQAARLEQDLTPLGAERAGNASGSIPRWEGGITAPPQDYQEGGYYLNPFPADQPLFTITAANVEQFKDYLSAGQLALFAAYPETFKMNIYPSRRSGSAPQWLYDNTAKNAVTAKLVNDGNGFVDAYGGVPFPIPQSGVEVVWNHITRYRGTYLTAQTSSAVVQRNGRFALTTGQIEVLFKYYQPNSSFAELNNLMFYYMIFVKSPARLAGGAVLVHETIDQTKEPRNAWIYTSGQRRVRRAPNIAYDTPIIDSEGLRTADDTDMYNGAPDRYDWELVGKQEVYITYNNYQIGSGKLKYKDILQTGHINPDYVRYELHRVWVVEGRLKPGARHIYARRTFYLDEDSWQIAIADQYDSRGELWRVSIAHLTNLYNLPTTWSSLEVYHDLQSRRYLALNLTDEEPKVISFTQKIPSDSNFTSAALIRRGGR
ncbi:hypothetical protein AXE65_01030 [Ventosimonas gracilis]|uniref:Outer membrane lipoprotein-sorting protein n=1 Tax=Ventosimonas gracilis TaxID=1680762 RepID=A0A139SVM6_9GAMM|nr:DUF1329 domain-containing protein [Ventosimonas gracilis]KXU38510.1 hypothetical protein AXE65_01030 [Ventosimonas gracilis]